MVDKKIKKTMPYLKSKYLEHVVSSMIERFNYKNVMEVPMLTQISVNMGIGDGKDNPKKLESAIQELTLITGQKPVTTLSRKDISNFKIRRGWPVGCKVTLRANQMFEFLDRLIAVALPRTRDFRGLSFKAFDGRGNYNFGIQEYAIPPDRTREMFPGFPEVRDGYMWSNGKPGLGIDLNEKMAKKIFFTF